MYRESYKLLGSFPRLLWSLWFHWEQWSSLAVIQDNTKSLAIAQDSIDLQLPNSEDLRDFPVKKERGETDLTSTRQSMAVNPTVSTDWAEPWWRVRHEAVFPSG